MVRVIQGKIIYLMIWGGTKRPNECSLVSSLLQSPFSNTCHLHLFPILEQSDIILVIVTGLSGIQ